MYVLKWILTRLISMTKKAFLLGVKCVSPLLNLGDFGSRNKVDYQDVDLANAFSLSTYTGNNSSQSINNGLNLTSDGGLVVVRNLSVYANFAYQDSVRPMETTLFSYGRDEANMSGEGIYSFNSNGFSVRGNERDINRASELFEAFAWKQTPGFFETQIVTKSPGSDAVVDLSTLGTLGMVWVKRRDATGYWIVWHRSITPGYRVYMNSDIYEFAGSQISVSGTTVTLLEGVIDDGNYVVYGWAHNPSVIHCGHYIGNGNTFGPEVHLGWRPQYLLLKCLGPSKGTWTLHDSLREPVNPRDSYLVIHDGNQAYSGRDVNFLESGFQILSDVTDINGIGEKIAYMAISEG